MSLMVDRLVPMPHLMSVTLYDKMRFWAKYKVGTSNECWPWLACIVNGVGSFSFKGQDYRAPRIAYFFEYKQDPGKLHVLHDCHNSVCVNHSHLHLGTQQENMQEKADVGRCARGMNHANAKFFESDILKIRDRYASGDTVTMIAQSSGVTYATIWDIVNRQTWRHVP